MQPLASKVLSGREVEERALWLQIGLHESWGESQRRVSQQWQGLELLQAYDRLVQRGCAATAACPCAPAAPHSCLPKVLAGNAERFTAVCAPSSLQCWWLDNLLRGGHRPVVDCSFLLLACRCGEVTSEYAKTFFLGTQLMTPEQAKAIWAIYVWCR